VLAAYVSGHGFGHLTRLCEVLRRVRELAPALPIAVVGTVPPQMVCGEVAGPLELRAQGCDVGLAQRDALQIDEAATLARCRAFEAGWDALVESEAAFLRARGARLVLADLPALAFDAAARAGVPALGMGNFSWDWVYAHLAKRLPAFQASADRGSAAYRKAELLLELPFAGDLSVFRRREKVGFVARRPRMARGEVRLRLSWPEGPLVLVSFGGLGLDGLRPGALEADPGVRYVFPEELSEDRLSGAGVRYPDAVAAADVVVTKPGYGIVTDAIGGGTRLVYTDRGDFPEYPILVREMAPWVASVYVPSSALREGRIREPVHRALSLPVPPPPDLGGADRAARRVLEFLA
jgi:L-arabinokinase